MSVLRLFTSGGFICLDSNSILLMQVSISFAITSLIVLLAFYSIVYFHVNLFAPYLLNLLLVICSILLIAFGSIVSLAIILVLSPFS